MPTSFLGKQSILCLFDFYLKMKFSAIHYKECQMYNSMFYLRQSYFVRKIGKNGDEEDGEGVKNSSKMDDVICEWSIIRVNH